MSARTRRFLAWSLMAALGLSAAPLAGKERKGARVVVERKDGSSISGELLMVKRDCLVVESQAVGTIVNLGEIGSVRIKKKSKAGTGFLIGFLGGTLVAFGISRDSHSCNDAVMDAGLSGFFIGLPAGSLGALIGLGMGKDLVMNVDKRGAETLLIKLNRYARVPDAAFSPGRQSPAAPL